MKILEPRSFMPSKGFQRRSVSAHLAAFSLFFVSSTRDSTGAFEGYMRGLFQSERANMLRMSEGNEVDHQAMQYLLTDGLRGLARVWSTDGAGSEHPVGWYLRRLDFG